MAKMEERLKAESQARAKAEERLKAEIETRASAERKVKAETEKMLLTQHRRYSVLAERIEAQAKEEIAAAKAEAKEAVEKARSYKAALAQAEEKLTNAEEKAKTQAMASAKAEKGLLVSAKAEAAAGKAESKERQRAEAQAKEEIAAARAQAEEKIRSYAAALAQAEEKLTKAEEKAKTEAIARAKAEEGLLVSAKAEAAAGKDESKKRQSVEVQPAKTTRTFKRIRRHIFHPGAIKKSKFTLIAALAVFSIVAFTVSITKNPPTPSYAGAAIEENPPLAIGDTTITQEGTPVPITLMGSDPDGERLTYNVVTTPSHGSLSGTAPSMTYTPRLNYNGPDSFTFSVNNGKADSEQAMMSITVLAVNDAPVITSAPVTTATAGALYTYNVDATDPDAGDTLTYSLTTKPADMTIHSATGLIQWKPTNAQIGTNEVAVVKVVDSNSIPALDTQSFTITVNPAPPQIAKLTVLDGYNQKNRKTLSADGKTKLVQSSDNNRWPTSFGSYTSYDFPDVSIPADSAITSVVIFVEHFEEERFAQEKLEWAVGTGWPTKPVVWASINAPVHEGQSNEAIDSWDVTNIADTREKIKSLQLKVKNNNNVTNRKTLIDYIYVVVKWD